VRKRLAGVLAGARVLRQSDSAFSAWLEQFTERTDPILSWRGVVFALLVAAQLGLPARHATARILSDAITAIWAVFVAYSALKLWLAPRKLRFLRSHWLQLLGLLAPTLRLLSFLRLARLGRVLPAARVLSASYRTVGTAGQLVRSRVAYLAGLSSIAIVVVGELGYLFDGGPDRDLPTLQAALLWSAATVIGMSPTVNPTTELGQLVMVAGFVVGLVLVTTLAGTLGAFLLQACAERPAGNPPAGPAPGDTSESLR